MFKNKFKSIIRILGIIYVLIISFLFIVGTIVSYLSETFHLKDYINFILQITALIGMFAYLFKKKLFGRNFWKIIFVSIVLWDTIFYFVHDILYPSQENSIGIVIGIYLMQIPVYLSLYLYSFSSRNTFSGYFDTIEDLREVQDNSTPDSNTTHTLKIGKYMRDSEIIEKRSNERKISIQSIVSLLLIPLAIIWYGASFVIDAMGQISSENRPYLMVLTLLLLLLSLVLGIIDLCKKNRKKVLSIISVTLSSLPLLLFLLLALIMAAFK